MKKLKLIIFLILIFILPVRGEHAGNKTSFYDSRSYARARIVKIEKRDIDKEQALKLTEVRIHLEILDGEFKGKTKIATFGGESNLPKDMAYKVGDTYFIGISKTSRIDSAGYISIYDVDNTKSILFMVCLMLLAIIIIGRLKGVASVIALSITIMLLFLVLIPLTLKGYPPLPIAVCISIFSILITLPIIAGIKLKTLAAILGAAGGIITASFLAIASGWIMHLSGLVTNEMLTVFYVSDIDIDLRGLVLSGMIIAALGAIMDVCISIASSTAEIFSANPEISEREAFKSVLNIGTDILGSMVNTLILAYVGSSLSLIMLISIKLEPHMPFWMVLNYNPVTNEIIKSVVGSIGMFMAIPLTAFISVRLYKRAISRSS